jgi:hypothetical protein
VQTQDSTTLTLVQPTARRREWELRDAAGLLALLRLPAFRSGAEAEIDDDCLRIQRVRGMRGGYAVVDEATGSEIARLRREGSEQLLELEGVAYRWRRVEGRFGFVGDDGEPIVSAKVRSGLLRSSGEASVKPGTERRPAIVAALLACYLLIRRNDQAAAAAGGAVAATTAG